MIKYAILAFIVTLSSTANCANNWHPTKGSMLTTWGEQINPDKVWTEYPRPTLVRDNWLNLNGLWNFAITPRESSAPQIWPQQILVPFVVESPLSGIGQRVQPEQALWYQTNFNYNAAINKHTLLNFEGVDYYCQVWLNDIAVGTHKGGNLPFSFDISTAVKPGNNILTVKVIDDTDKKGAYQLRGKQKVDNGFIWYSPSSGIWQTVWLEQVPQSYIASAKLTADMQGKLKVTAEILGNLVTNTQLRLTLLDDTKIIGQKTTIGNELNLITKGIKLWSPTSPKLYNVKIELLSNTGEIIDQIDSYTGFRTVGKVKDEQGNWRFTLNGQNIFHWGPLDQGWWPDGFLTPPSEQAYLFEMQYLKQAGFNMIRKHKKVEPRRYYYQADRLGLLIWQDQVSGGVSGKTSTEWPKWKRPEALTKHYKTTNANWWQNESDPIEAIWPTWAHEQYMAELKSMIDTLYNNPSVVVWTTFNERWGQHNTISTGKFVTEYDPSRHLNIASGGNFFPIGDIVDQHQYPDPSFPFDVPLYQKYIKVVGEFGGHGWSVQGHEWQSDKKKFVYGKMPKTIEELIERYTQSIEVLGKLKKQGVAAGVYTQTTDVEVELNGLMTYDRKVIKIPAEQLKRIYQNNLTEQ